MFTYDCLLAALLLTAPPEIPLDPACAAFLEPLRPAVIQLALDAEVLDRREEHFTMQRAQDLSADLQSIQRRSESLAYAPLAEECQRFPTRAVVNELLSFNRAYRNDLLARMALDSIHAEALQSALAETDQLYLIWETLRDARCDFYYVTVRRQSLAQLRDLIGLHAFYSGQLPPHVPYWHFPLQPPR